MSAIENLEAENERLRKAQTWQPPETTPKGKENSKIKIEFLGLGTNKKQYIGHMFRINEGNWKFYSGADIITLTGWMPLPPISKKE